MNYNQNSQNSHYGVHLLKGVVFSYLITFALFVIFAIILTYTSLSENIIPTVNSVIMIISIALGAVYLSIKAENMGWVHGGLIGCIYIVIMIIARGLILKEFDFDIYLLIRVIIGLVTGAVGGMIGINVK